MQENTAPKLESITVTYLLTIFEKDGWQVMRGRMENGRQVTIAGRQLPSDPDVKMRLYGSWVNHVKYGLQFNAQAAEILLPVSKAGVISYLRSLRIGIGPKKAERIYAVFGGEIWDVLASEPGRLLEVTGVTPKILEKLTGKLKETMAIQHIMREFQGVQDMTVVKAQRIVNAFGEEALDILRQNPYKLCTVTGFSFRNVDRMALEKGVSVHSLERQKAAVQEIFKQNKAKGHTCMPALALIQQMMQLLNTSPKPVPAEICEQSIEVMTTIGFLKRTDGMLYPAKEYRQESAIGSILLAMTGRSADTVDIEAYLAAYQEETGITLAEKQADAVRCCMACNVSVITGGPGTGKTTTINALLRIFEMACGSEAEAVLLAPTGRAARRMSETTNHPASTIHAAIGFTGVGETCETSELEGDLFIIDETSMMDQQIACLFLERLPMNARLVLVGDPDQLPSIGCGNVLMDIIHSGAVPTVKLDVIYRQAQESPIIRNAHAINRGDTNLWFSKDFRLFAANSPESIFSFACKFYCSCVREYGLDNVILLNPYRTKTLLCVNAFNRELQNAVNPPRMDEPAITAGNISFRPRDKIMQMKNTQRAKNGDVGYIRSIDRKESEDDPEEWEYIANVEFNGNGKILQYTREDLTDVDLGYCSTIHKSQGSQYETVLVVLSNTHGFSLKRKLLYTAVTRAEKHVALIVERSAIDRAIRNDREDVRYTYLCQRLQAGIPNKELYAT